MTKPELVEAILEMDSTARPTRLKRLKKAVLVQRLSELQAAAATREEVVEKKAAVHDWRQMFDGPETNEYWSGPDSGRWCSVCGMSVYNVAATEKADEGVPCEPPVPLERTLTVRGVKSFRGMEGGGFNCTLYVDGKKLGMVIDEGRGGNLLYRLDSHKTEQELERWARVKSQDGMEALDSVVGKLVDDEEERRWLKRHTKKKTVIRLKDHGRGEWTTYAKPYSAEFAAWIREKHGDDLVEIGNEREGLA